MAFQTINNMIKLCKWFFLTCFLIPCNSSIYAQKKFFTRVGQVVFFSKAPLEDIKAVNKHVSCVYDAATNKIIAKVLIKAFEFDKSLMQKHFNENYLESDKFPKASFKGKILNTENLNFNDNWSKELAFEGELNLHGVKKKIRNPVYVTLKDGKMKVKCTFHVLLKDYEIKVPSTVINNIAEKIKISVNLEMNELKN